MPREKKIPDKPRFDFVTQTAYKFLLECGYTRFPISPYDVLDELKDYVVCLPWSKAKKVMKSEDPFHLRQQKAEGRTIRMRSTGLYYIIYDDVKVSSPDRISWTIMHEIGHVILGHLIEFSETALNRGGMTSEQYGVLEVEAHYFAAEFLMPTAILKYFTGITVDEIALLFGVSDEAAEKKYKRVFETDYLPSGKHDKLVLRNFYKFLITETDEAIYRSIYRAWGMPWKSKYVPVCRKCPECYSYIDDSKAHNCPYCGGVIERSVMYNNMFERMKSRSEFTKIPGTKHHRYPYSEELTINGSKRTKVTVCPTCLNHDFSSGATHCRICGNPLINEADCIDDCFSKEDGRETSSNTWYPIFEKRYQRLISYRGVYYREDWVDYDYWEFTKFMMRGVRSEVSMDLQSAILYSYAFMDDNDDVFIITDTVMAAQIIKAEINTVLSYLKETDNIERSQVEVFAVNDL
ncbi:MAG: ImmA/IrrE family metallo-endopeptidase [Lachnospiraceae bacterium]|nr:ImmA/IrrE family metallo-endopeptidase [Lachnospiraceae bacterium]